MDAMNEGGVEVKVEGNKGKKESIK